MLQQPLCQCSSASHLILCFWGFFVHLLPYTQLILNGFLGWIMDIFCPTVSYFYYDAPCALPEAKWFESTTSFFKVFLYLGWSCQPFEWNVVSEGRQWHNETIYDLSGFFQITFKHPQQNVRYPVAGYSVSAQICGNSKSERWQTRHTTRAAAPSCSPMTHNP